ncbi:MAG: hypothetical protein KDB90_01750 [Planctomycetes bacterium]|nr:hypothetical protein [Planctomycetota bacterium]
MSLKASTANPPGLRLLALAAACLLLHGCAMLSPAPVSENELLFGSLDSYLKKRPSLVPQVVYAGVRREHDYQQIFFQSGALSASSIVPAGYHPVRTDAFLQELMSLRYWVVRARRPEERNFEQAFNSRMGSATHGYELIVGLDSPDGPMVAEIGVMLSENDPDIVNRLKTLIDTSPVIKDEHWPVSDD